MGLSRLAELAATISAHATQLDDYIKANNLPDLSFDTDGPIQLALPESLAASQDVLLDSANELRALLLGPIGILQYVCEHNNLVSLHAINRFKIAESFPSDQEASFTQISSKCGLNESDTRRILRHAMTNHIFKEPRKGVVAHTAASKALAEIPMLREWVGMVSEELAPAAPRVADALVKWPNSEEPNETGFNLAMNTVSPMYDELANYPVREQRFADAMSLFSSSPGFEPVYLATNYDWKSIGTGTIVDVGGSHGYVSIELARTFPDLHCIVQDLPKTVADGEKALPKDVADRVKFMAHDFFTEQPVKNADVYYFRWIFHNWSDKYCIKILRKLVPALKHGARIIVNELCIPEPGMLSKFQEKPLRSFDIVMMECYNAKERDVEEWAQLFLAADSRFMFRGVKVPMGSKLAIIEVSWEEV
ncbi:hypothetical protein MMC17_002717 [Xylographa soralifera]|nr:hypothetical protein [Xylographa soralifera]